MLAISALSLIAFAVSGAPMWLACAALFAIASGPLDPPGSRPLT